MRMRERVLNRGIPAPRDTLLLQVSQKRKRPSMFFLRFRVHCHAHESPSRQQKSNGRLPSIPSTPQVITEAENRPLDGRAGCIAHGALGALPTRVASYYHRTAEARSWRNGRATWARRKTSSMSKAIPARAVDHNGRRGDHTKPKDPHHPHHAYPWWPWDGKCPL